MSQQGFPNMGIMPDNVTTGSYPQNYSVFIKTEAEIKVLAQELSNQAFNSGIIPQQQLNIASQAEGIITAALGFAQYYHQQQSYTGSDGVGSQSNPAQPVFGDTTKAYFLQTLGNNPNPSSLYTEYKYGQPGPKDAVGVQNFFFNLGLKADAFSWGSDGLTVSDIYRFSGINDFGVSPPQNLKLSGDVIGMLPYLITSVVGAGIGAVIFGPLALRKSGLNIINEVIFFYH